MPSHTSKDQINIIYTHAERTDAQVTTVQTPQGSSTLADDIMIGSKKLSEILKTEIIPNTVNSILTRYPAFSYLKGSSIGIGLKYFSEGSSGGTTTLAYVSAEAGSSGSTDGSGNLISRTDYITYTLGVNTSVLNSSMTRQDLEDLEATIAHEMVHAFMDEALTSGMFGLAEINGAYRKFNGCSALKGNQKNIARFSRGKRCQPVWYRLSGMYVSWFIYCKWRYCCISHRYRCHFY